MSIPLFCSLSYMLSCCACSPLVVGLDDLHDVARVGEVEPHEGLQHLLVALRGVLGLVMTFSHFRSRGKKRDVSIFRSKDHALSDRKSVCDCVYGNDDGRTVSLSSSAFSASMSCIFFSSAL